MSTIFSQIISRDIPAQIIYEDELVVAFFDNQPVHPGHTLVVPKTAYENIFDLPADLLAHIARVGQRVALAVRDSTQADGVNVYMNNGAAAGQEVWHAHLHVVPRFTNDQRYTAPIRATDVNEAAVNELAATLTEKLQ